MAVRENTPAGPGGLADSILGGLTAGRGETAPHAEFIYPKRGGIESLAEGLLRSLKPLAPVCGAEVLKIDARRRTVTTSRGEVRYGRLVSTLPLDRAVRLAELERAARSAGRLVIPACAAGLLLLGAAAWRHGIGF